MIQRIAAVAMAASGLWFIVRRWSEYPHVVKMLEETIRVAGPWVAVLAGLLMLLPILRVGAAIGLWRLRRTARHAALFILTVDLLTLAIVIVRFQLAAAGKPGVSELDMSGATVVEVYSMWPTYIACAVTALCLYMLMRRPTRDLHPGRRVVA